MPLPLTVRERAILGLIATLGGITEIPELKIFRNRRNVTEFPALSVLDGDQAPLPEETGVQRYMAKPTILGFVKETGDEDPAPALNALYGIVVKKVLADAITGGPIGQIALEVTEGEMQTFVDPEGDADRQGQFDLVMNIQFMTVENDPFLLPDE